MAYSGFFGQRHLVPAGSDEILNRGFYSRISSGCFENAPDGVFRKIVETLDEEEIAVIGVAAATSFEFLHQIFGLVAINVITFNVILLRRIKR